jgi:sulfatase modifying factor 1
MATMATTHPRGPSRRRSLRPSAASGAVTLAAGALLLVWSWPVAARIAAAAGAAQSADAVTLEQLLERAGAYVLGFETRFSNVVTEERYVQESTEAARPGMIIQSTGGRGVPMAPQPIAPNVQRRELVSDFLLVKLSETDMWLPFRDVFEVDKQQVRDREDRLSKLFLHPTGSTFEQAVRIMEESARYNIGKVQRTVNLPVLALEVLWPRIQPSFRFSKGKLDSSIGANVYIVEYREQEPPALIHGPQGRDMFCHGRFWIEAPTGRVMKSELIVDDVTVHASVTTRYQVDQAYGLAVPVDMKEDYGLPNGARVTGLATYGNFRRFDVQVADTIAKPPRTITDAQTSMTLVEIPAGRFVMGSPPTEARRGNDETQHVVSISRSFFLGQFEVTQAEWRSVMNTSPSQFADCGLSCPVERVSYGDVQQFLDALNAHASDVRYRLPSETEWEYACRAGSTTPFTTGNNITTAQANYNGLRPYASFSTGVARERPTLVGTFDANVWGLGDMHGNVQEWTSDWYARYPSGDVQDPRGPASGTRRVVRGGSWLSDASGLRCAVRDAHAPTDRNGSLGFRVAGDFVTR